MRKLNIRIDVDAPPINMPQEIEPDIYSSNKYKDSPDNSNRLYESPKNQDGRIPIGASASLPNMID